MNKVLENTTYGNESEALGTTEVEHLDGLSLGKSALSVDTPAPRGQVKQVAKTDM